MISLQEAKNHSVWKETLLSLIEGETKMLNGVIFPVPIFITAWNIPVYVCGQSAVLCLIGTAIQML